MLIIRRLMCLLGVHKYRLYLAHKAGREYIVTAKECRYCGRLKAVWEVLDEQSFNDLYNK